MDEKLTIGIADMKLTQNAGTLITHALGSCVGICLYDPAIKLGALIHILLPLNMEAGRTNTLKYADTGIRYTLGQMIARGGQKSRITAKIAGGAKMFEMSGGLGNIGQRNAESARMVLKQEGIPIMAADVGGGVARTLIFDVASGKATVRSYGSPEKTL